MYLFGRVPAYHRPCNRFDFRYPIKTAHSSMFVIPALGKGRKEKKIRSSRPFLLLYQIWGQPERNETLSLRKIVLSVLSPSLPLSPHLPVPLPSCSGSSFPCYIVWNCLLKREHYDFSFYFSDDCENFWSLRRLYVGESFLGCCFLLLFVYL